MKISSHKELQISQEDDNLFTQRAANITRIFFKKKGFSVGRPLIKKNLRISPMQA
jgi:hypothetical protein